MLFGSQCNTFRCKFMSEFRNHILCFDHNLTKVCWASANSQYFPIHYLKECAFQFQIWCLYKLVSSTYMKISKLHNVILPIFTCIARCFDKYNDESSVEKLDIDFHSKHYCRLYKKYSCLQIIVSNFVEKMTREKSI